MPVRIFSSRKKMAEAKTAQFNRPSQGYLPKTLKGFSTSQACVNAHHLL